MLNLQQSTCNALELSDDDKFIERYAERTIARLICSDSSTHAIRMHHFSDVLIVRDEHGQNSEIKARNICDIRTVRGFLNFEGLQNLTVAAYRIDNLADKYAMYLRTDYQKKNKNARYYLIKKENDLFWLKSICIFAIAECIGWNKRDLGAFIDDRAATLADLGFFLRRVRGFSHEAPNHMRKHHLDEQEREETANLLQNKITTIVEDLAERDLPGYVLEPLPEGVPDPLLLPTGEKTRE